MPTPIAWYFDFVSPFAYLQLEQFERLSAQLDITFKPVVLGALLTHWETKGPAEIPEKRRFVYRYAQHRAEQLGIPLRMPPAHPFNPIKALRLAVALGSRQETIQAIFRHIWRDGYGVTSDSEWKTLCDRLDIDAAEEAIARPEVKAELRRNTDEAIAAGVFGVPTFVLGEDLFWGEDGSAMLLRCLASPDWLQSEELRRISALPVGIRRNA